MFVCGKTYPAERPTSEIRTASAGYSGTAQDLAKLFREQNETLLKKQAQLDHVIAQQPSGILCETSPGHSLEWSSNVNAASCSLARIDEKTGLAAAHAYIEHMDEAFAEIWDI